MIVLEDEDDDDEGESSTQHLLSLNHSSSVAATVAVLASSNCLAFPSQAREAMKAVACDSQDSSQHFIKSNCVLIDTSLYPEFQALPTSPSRSAPASSSSAVEYCSLRGVESGMEEPGLMHDEDHLCVDISGMSPVPGRDLVGYPCLGNWNQYFRLSATGSIASTIPRVVSNVTGMGDYPSTLCVEGNYYTQHVGEQDLETEEEIDDRERDGEEPVYVKIKSSVCHPSTIRAPASVNHMTSNNSSGESHDSDGVGRVLEGPPSFTGIQRFRFVSLS